jgi:hypothetical protein
MVPAIVHLSCVAGDGFRHVFRFRDTDGNPVDVSGYIWAAQVRTHEDAIAYEAFDIDTTDAAVGDIVIALTGAQTRVLVGRNRWDLEFRTAANASPQTVFAGMFRVAKDVTRTGDDPTNPSGTTTSQVTVATLGEAITHVTTTAIGAPGPAGPGVPTGGTTGQVLKKATGSDYDTAWANDNDTTDHGQLTGLNDDDHQQYLNQTRGDARYVRPVGPTFTAATPAATFGPNLAPPLADWTPAGGASWSPPNMTIPSGGSVSAPVSVVEGRTYRIVVTRSASSGGPMTLAIGGTSISIVAWGPSGAALKALETGTVQCVVGGGAWAATVQDISIRQVTAFASPAVVAGVGEIRSQGTNVGMGMSALASDTDGTNNVAFGCLALANSSFGVRNVAIGYNALFSQRAGIRNTAIGHNAMYSNYSGFLNTAVGDGALYGITTGYYNVAVGCDALSAALNTIGNTAIGYAALRKNTGDNNVAVGNSALGENIGGHTNIAIGNSAGSRAAPSELPNTSPTYCAFIGSATRSSSDSSTNETVIGYGAVGGGDNTVTLGNGSVTNVLPGATNKAALGSPTRAFKTLHLHDGTDEWEIKINTSGQLVTTKV